MKRLSIVAALALAAAVGLHGVAAAAAAGSSRSSTTELADAWQSASDASFADAGSSSGSSSNHGPLVGPTATFEVEEHAPVTPHMRRLEEAGSGASSSSSAASGAAFARRLSFNGKDSLGGHVAFNGKAAVKKEVINVDTTGAEKVECSVESSAEAEGGERLTLRLVAPGLRAASGRWRPGATILVAGSQWNCGPSFDVSSPLYALIAPGTVPDVVSLPAGRDAVTLTAIRQPLAACFHAFSFNLKRTAPTQAQPEAHKGSRAARSLMPGSLSTGFAPFNWEFGENAVGKATWNVQPTVNGTADPAVVTVSRARVPINNTAGHVIVCTNCYAWLAADVHVQGEFGWASASTLEVSAGVYTSARFEVDAILNQTMAVQPYIAGYDNVTSFINRTDINGTSELIPTWDMVPRMAARVAQAGPSLMTLLPSTRVMTIEFMASGVPVAVPVTAKIDLRLDITYLPPPTNGTASKWNGVVTNAGFEAAGRLVLGTSCQTGKGCGPVRNEGLSINPTRPLYDLPGGSSSRLEVKVSPAISITASLFAGWDVTMTATPYVKASAVTGTEVARLCGPQMATYQPGGLYNNSRVYASLSKGMLGSVQLGAPLAAMTLGASCKDGQGCAGPFTFVGPVVPGASAAGPTTLGPYALVPEDAVPSSTSSGCVGNGLAIPVFDVRVGNTTNNVTALCTRPGACDYEIGEFDGGCDVDCGGPGVRSRSVRCRVRATAYNGVNVTFLAPKESCFYSPTSIRPVPPEDEQCAFPFTGASSRTVACGLVRVFPTNPIFPRENCNESVSVPYFLSASRQCTYQPSIQAWVYLYCSGGANIDAYRCSRADCPLDDASVCVKTAGAFQTSGCQANANSPLGAISFQASCPSFSVQITSGGAFDYMPVSMDGGRMVKLVYGSGGDVPVFRYYSVSVAGAVDSVVISGKIEKVSGSTEDIKVGDLSVWMSPTPFVCDNADTNRDICKTQSTNQPPFSPTTTYAVLPYDAPYSEASGLDVDSGAIDGLKMTKTVTLRSTTVRKNWGKLIYIAVRCWQSCTFYGTAYGRSSPGQGLFANFEIMPLESKQIVYRPSPTAAGMSLLVTSLEPITGNNPFGKGATVLVRPAVNRAIFSFPNLLDLGKPNVTSSTPMATNTSLLVPPSLQMNMDPRQVTRGLTLLPADGFNPAGEYLVSLISTGNDTQLTGRGTHLIQGFDLFSLTPGQGFSTALPANAKGGYIVTVPASSTSLTVVTTVTRGSVTVCVGPGSGLYDLRSCGTAVLGLNRLDVPTAGTSWLAGQRELTVLVTAATDAAFTIVALPLEVLDHGLPVTRLVRRGSRLTFAGPQDLPPAYSQTTPADRLSWAAAMRVSNQAPSPISLFAGTLSQYPTLPSDAAAEASAVALQPGTSKQVYGQYLPFARVQPVMLSIVPATHTSLLTGTFGQNYVLGQASAIPTDGVLATQGPMVYRRRAQQVISQSTWGFANMSGASMAVNAPDMYIYAPWAEAWLPGNSSAGHCSAPGVADALKVNAKDYGAASCAQVWIKPAFETTASPASGTITYLVVLPPSTQAQVQLLAPYDPGNGTAPNPPPAPLWSLCAEASVTSAECADPDYGDDPNVNIANCGSAPRGFRLSIQAVSTLDEVLKYAQYLYLTVAHRPAVPSTTCPMYTWSTGKWSKCSQLCTLGFQTRDVMCTDQATGEVVEDAMCPPIKPAFKRDCNTGPCVIVKGPWSECPRPCLLLGAENPLPYQYRSVACVNGGGQGVVVPDALCTYYDFNVNGTMVNITSVANTPLSQICLGLPQCDISTSPPVGYFWLGDWSACTATCDGGMQTRRVYCANAYGQPLSDVWCLRLPRPVSSRPCGVAPCAGSEVQVAFGDVRKLVTGQIAPGVFANTLPPIQDSIPAGGMRFYSAHRASPSDRGLCIDANVSSVMDNCTSAALAEAASCASALQACLSSVGQNLTALASADSYPVAPYGTPYEKAPFAIAATACECYAQAQICAASKRCASASDIDRMVDSISTDCRASVCGPVNATACNARPDIKPYKFGMGGPVLHMYANRIRSGQSLADVQLPMSHGTAEMWAGSWAGGRQSLCINGSTFDRDVEGLLVGVKAVEAGVSVLVTANALTPYNGTIGPIVTLSGRLYSGDTYDVNVTVPPVLAYNYLRQKYLPIVNGTWRIETVDTRVITDVNVSLGYNMTMRIELAYDAFVDPNAQTARVAASYGLPLSSTGVHYNALLAGMRPMSVAGPKPSGGWEDVALPLLLAPGAPKAVFFRDGDSVCDIILPPIPGYAPRASETFTFTIPGQFLRSGHDMTLNDFRVTFNSTGARDCAVGSWTEWTQCPAVPCAAPGQPNPLGNVPLPAMVQTRTRPVLVYPRGAGVLQCPPLAESRKCDSCNPCAYVKCDNGGLCVEGKCVCPGGYAGPDCSLPPPTLSIWKAWTESAWSSCLDAATSGSGKRFRYVNCSASAGVRPVVAFVNRTAVMETPTPSVTPSPSSTKAGTVSPTPSITPSTTPTVTFPSSSPTGTPTPTTTISASPTVSDTPSPTGSVSTSPTASFTSTNTATASGTPTTSSTATFTPSQRTSVTPTPSITPSQFWFNTTVNATANATILPPPVYAPPFCGPLGIPAWWEQCALPGIDEKTVLPTQPIGNVTVLRVTVPLMESLGINGSALLNNIAVQDGWSAAFMAHLHRALQILPTGQLVFVSVGRCSRQNFLPAGRSQGDYLRTTPSATPMQVPWRPQTAQLDGSAPVICATLEYTEDIMRQPTLSYHFLYRLAVLMGAGVSNPALVGGVDLRPLIVTGVQPGTHLLLPLSKMGIPEGTGFVNYSYLAVAGNPFGFPPNNIMPMGLITSLPGLDRGYLPSAIVVVSDAGAAPLRSALTAFIVLFIIVGGALFAFYKKRGFSDRAPRARRTSSRRGTLANIGEVVNPLAAGNRSMSMMAISSASGSSGEEQGASVLSMVGLGTTAGSGPVISSAGPSLYVSEPTPVGVTNPNFRPTQAVGAPKTAPSFLNPVRPSEGSAGAAAV